MTRSVAVIAAHPDDEVLGCGGVIARHREAGDDVCVIFMTDGVGARGSHSAEALRRSEAMKHAMKILRVGRVDAFDWPDNAMDSVPRLEIVKRLESVLSSIRPSVIYTHFCGDLNVDHRITCEAVLTACRPQPSSSVVQILSFEVPSSTGWAAGVYADFNPNVFVDIEPWWGLKKQALEAYSEEMRPWPHARSIEALDVLAQMRGSHIGLQRAEAFMNLRMLIK